jgi:rSAM/selenodomain-associated transferase 2
MFAVILWILIIAGKQMRVQEPISNINCQGLRLKSSPDGRGPSSRTARFPAACGVSVIIPSYNEEKNIGDCIRSVQKAGEPAEIIVVDGGSTDRTREIVEALSGVRLFSSAPGRGIQIAAGVYHARQDIVMVLHADSRLLPDTISRMLASLRNKPGAVGGCFGAIYDDKRIRMRWIEVLNRFRAVVSGISFGDQAQFFRRELFADSFPAIKLMEDVELSLRMKENGALLFIPRGVIASSRKWQRAGYGSNFRNVIYLTALYLIKRRFGRLSGDCDDFYRKYYENPLNR